MAPTADFARATDFIWRTARLIDRLRFAYLFLDGDRQAVLAALRAYQNADGGFGHALEPDLRAPVSQPAPVRSALEMLDQIDGFADPMVKRACDYLLTITTSDGGVPFMLPSILTYPRPPWLQTTDNSLASITFTAPIAGLLHKHRVAHPWLERASDYCWRQAFAFDVTEAEGATWTIAKIEKSYEARALLVFLQHVPDRRRAEEAFARIGRLVRERKLVELEVTALGEVHRPLDYAPSPHSLARSLFSDEVISVHLDALVAAQQSDGGWMFNWKDWNPAATLEWRGWLTVETLGILRAYGRLPGVPI
jgi:hypothetical protein